MGAFFAMPCLVCGEGDQPCCLDCWPKPEISISLLDGLPKVSGADYRNLSPFILPLKDQGLMAMVRVLAPIASQALSAMAEHLERQSVISSGSRINLVYPPSSRANMRKRGFNPAERLLRLAGSSNQFRIHDGFDLMRGVSDQGQLTKAGRELNLVGSLRATLHGLERVLIFDDITASGATLREMRRALEVAGNRVVGHCVLAESFLKSTP